MTAELPTSGLSIALYEPEIPQNTGNIIRLCANAGARLHLIGPLGFVWDDRRLRRAGLDYHDLARVQRHNNWQRFVDQLAGARLLGFSTRGKTSYTRCQYQPADVLLFGPETRGLPDEVLAQCSDTLKIPMAPGARSINLANSVAVATYEAWRQQGFALAPNRPNHNSGKLQR